ncbi:MAG: Ig-like domain repeat protein [Candidatus Heimdallarchaeota archaeon]|nr:Ig-like domain repeat protein [Candidatus Heimdallarchaeota archaeon]
MRKLLLVLLMAILLQLNTNASFGGLIDTTTTLSTPQDTDYNAIIELQAITSTPDPVFMGSTVFTEITRQIRLGSAFTPYTTTNSKFNYNFTLDITQHLMGLKIPIVDIATQSQYIQLSIYEDNELIHLSHVDDSQYQRSIDDGYLLFVFASGQTDTGTDITITRSWEYSIELEVPLGSITIPTGPQTDLLINGEEGGYLYLLKGSVLDTVDVSSGMASIYYQVPLGKVTIISYYYEGDLFGPSYDELQITATNIGLSVLMGDVSCNSGERATVDGTVRINNNLLSGANVDLFLISKTREYIGNQQSTGDGVSFEISCDYLPGEYTLEMVASYLTESITDTSILTVTKPTAIFHSVIAQGQYLKSGYTQINIEGKLGFEGNPVDNLIELNWEDKSVELQVELGVFAYSMNTSLLPGTYTDYYSIKNLNSMWDIEEVFVDLVITPGEIFINVANYEVEYLAQPITIEASVKNSVNEHITTQLDVFVWQGDDYILLGSMTEQNISYSYTLPSLEFGLHTLKLVAHDTPIYAKSIRTCNIQIGGSEVVLSRGILRDHLDIEFNNMGNFSIQVLDTEGNPLSNVLLGYFSNDQGIMRNIANRTTGSDGWVYFSYLPRPTINFLGNYPEYTMHIIVLEDAFYGYAYDISYTMQLLDIETETESLLGYAGEISIFSVPLLDSQGLAIQEDFVYTVKLLDGDTILSTKSHTTLEGSVIHFEFNFDTLGTYILQILTPDQWIYHGWTYNVEISISTGQYVIDANNIHTLQGIHTAFVAYIGTQARHNVSDQVARLYIMNQGWQLIGTSISDINGRVEIITQILKNPGIYDFKWEIQGDTNYLGDSIELSLFVDGIASEIIVDTSPIYQYSESIELSIYLGVPGVSGISGTISIFLADDIYQVFTDNTGYASLSIPGDYEPGSYLIHFSYDGNTQYNASTAQVTIEIGGKPTTLNFIGQYNMTYATHVNFLVRLTSGGFGIEGINVELEVDGKFYYAVTNETGYASYRLFLLATTGEYEIYAKMRATAGYEASEDSIMIQVRKLDMKIGIQMSNETYHSSWLEILIQLSVEATIEIKYDHGLLYYGKETEIFLQLTMDPGTYNLEFIISHPYYNTYNANYPLIINPLPIQMEYSLPDFTYQQSSSIEFSVYDLFDHPYTGNVTIKLFSDRLLTSQVVMLYNGFGVVNIIPPEAGELQLYFIISQSPYEYTEMMSTITVNMVMPEIRYDVIDDSSQVIINVTVLANGVIQDVDVELYRFTSSWTYIKTGSLFKISMQSDYIFRIIFPGSNDLSATQTEGAIFLQNPNLEDKNIRAVFPHINLNATLRGNTTLDGYTLNYALGTLDGSIISVDGDIILDILHFYPPGEYQLLLEFPQQGWYAHQLWTIDITIEKATPTITVQSTELSFGRQVNYTISAEIDDFILDGVKITVVFNGVEIGSGILNNEKFHILIDTNIPLGEYILLVRLDEGMYTKAISDEFTISILNETDLTVSVSAGSFFDDGVLLAVLIDPSTNKGIRDQELYVYLEDELLVKLITNSSGMAEYRIAGLLPGIYTIKVIQPSTEIYFGNDIEVQYGVRQGEVDISLDVIDRGITHGISINISLTEDVDEVIFWYILDTEFSGEFVHHTTLNFEGDMVGTYNIVFEWQGFSEYYEINPNEYTFGYEAVDAEVILLNSTVGYGSDIVLQVYHNDIMLKGIELEIRLDGTTYYRLTDENGTIQISTTQLLDGNYSLEIVIDISTIIKQPYSHTFNLRVIKGNLPFSIKDTELFYGQRQLEIEDPMNGNYTVILNGDKRTGIKLIDGKLDIGVLLNVGEYNISIIREHYRMYTFFVNTTITVLPVDTTIQTLVTEESISFMVYSNITYAEIVNYEFSILVYRDGVLIENITSSTSTRYIYFLEDGEYVIYFNLINNYNGQVTALITPEGSISFNYELGIALAMVLVMGITIIKKKVMK